METKLIRKDFSDIKARFKARYGGADSKLAAIKRFKQIKMKTGEEFVEFLQRYLAAAHEAGEEDLDKNVLAAGCYQSGF